MKKSTLSKTYLNYANKRLKKLQKNNKIQNYNPSVTYMDTGKYLMGVDIDLENLIFTDNNEIKNGTNIIYTQPENGLILKENKQVKLNQIKDLKIELVKVNDIDYDESVFKPLKLNNPMDYMFSQKGGVMPGTNYIISGVPGGGKTTLVLNLGVDVEKNNKNKEVLFISGEMNQLDMKEYVDRYNSIGDIKTLFVADYTDYSLKTILEQIFNDGWDLVIIDSFAEIVSSVRDTDKLSASEAEKWLIDLMVKHNKANNDKKKHTSFLAIQQVTKGGMFVGSNKLKHNTTGMLHIDMKDGYVEDRFITVTKNRRGFKYNKVHFKLDIKDAINYDEQKLKRDLEIAEQLSNEREQLMNEESLFDKLFGYEVENN